MNTPSVDIKDMLAAESSLGLVFNNNLFIGRMPSKPRDIVVVYDTYGPPPDLGLTEVGYERPNIQIIVRDNSYLSGMMLAQDIKDSLHGRKQETWNKTLYTLVVCLGSPALLKWDEEGIVTFSVNFNIQRRQV